jgi:hypothetical protein
MNTTLTGNEPGLVGYWDFDDGTANDLSPNRNDGTLYAGATIVESDLRLAPGGIDTMDGFSAVPVNQKGQFVLTTGIGRGEAIKPIKTIQIRTPKEFSKPGAKAVDDVMIEKRRVKASSAQVGSVLRIHLEEGITEAGVLKAKFETTAGPATASNVMFSVKLLASDGRVIRESREGLGGIAVISDAPLPVPRDVAARPVAGENDVEISWKAVDDPRVAGYEILATWEEARRRGGERARGRRSEGSRKRVMEIQGRETTTHKHVSAPPGIEISYAVRAVSTSSLKSKLSGSVIDTVGQDTTPPEISHLKARKVVDSETGDSGTEVEWEITGAQDIAGYEILRSRSPAAREFNLREMRRGTTEIQRRRRPRGLRNVERIAELGANVREYIDKIPRAYIYAVDAIDDRGNRARYSMLEGDGKAREQGSEGASIEHPAIILGDENISDGIRMPNAGYGQHEPATLAGRSCRRLRSGSENFYFDIDDQYVYGYVPDMYVTVEYFDEGMDWFGLAYGEKRNESIYTRIVAQKLQDTKRWSQATFHLPDPHFANALDFLCDFAIGLGFDRPLASPLAIAKVTVARNHPLQGKGAYASVPLRTMSYAMIGPLDVTAPEQEIDLNKAYTVDDKPVRWFESFPYAEYQGVSQNIDLIGIYGSPVQDNFYALTYLESPDDMLVKLDDLLVELSKYSMANFWINNIPVHNITQS